MDPWKLQQGWQELTEGFAWAQHVALKWGPTKKTSPLLRDDKRPSKFTMHMDGKCCLPRIEGLLWAWVKNNDDQDMDRRLGSLFPPTGASLFLGLPHLPPIPCHERRPRAVGCVSCFSCQQVLAHVSICQGKPICWRVILCSLDSLPLEPISKRESTARSMPRGLRGSHGIVSLFAWLPCRGTGGWWSAVVEGSGVGAGGGGCSARKLCFVFVVLFYLFVTLLGPKGGCLGVWGWGLCLHDQNSIGSLSH